MSEFDGILYEVESARARITLNRPEKLNALTPGIRSALSEALWEADDNADVHCVILCGAERAFSTGYDLSGAPESAAASKPRSAGQRRRGHQGADDDAWQLERAQRWRMALFDMHKPSICQLHGYCLAGGTDIALMCDMIIVADDALIGVPPVRSLGAMPTNMWLCHAGPQWAKRLNLTGDMVSGAEAQQIGLVMKAVAAERLEAEVEQLADRLALIDPDLLSANKRIVNAALELMGARTLQRLAAENDARAHGAKAAEAFRRAASERGMRQALRERDEKFGDARARQRAGNPRRGGAAGRRLSSARRRSRRPMCDNGSRVSLTSMLDSPASGRPLFA